VLYTADLDVLIAMYGSVRLESHSHHDHAPIVHSHAACHKEMEA